MMKINYCIILLIITMNSFAQKNLFEGTITYKIELKNPNPKIISDSLWNAKMKGKVEYQKYYYKKNMYKSTIDKKAIQIYNPEDNLLYNYKISNDTILINKISAEKSIDPIQSVKNEESTIEILGYSCEKIIIKGKVSENTYYYSPLLKISSENFKEHNFGNWWRTFKGTYSNRP